MAEHKWSEYPVRHFEVSGTMQLMARTYDEAIDLAQSSVVMGPEGNGLGAVYALRFGVARLLDGEGEHIVLKPITNQEEAAPMKATTQKSVYQVGKNYLIRAVTHYYTGKLIAVTEQELVLQDAAWIADTGRFADAWKTGTFSEVEPYPSNVKVLVNRGAVVDVAEWPHSLPREQR